MACRVGIKFLANCLASEDEAVRSGIELEMYIPLVPIHGASAKCCAVFIGYFV